MTPDVTPPGLSSSELPLGSVLANHKVVPWLLLLSSRHTSLLSEVTGEARPYGKETVDLWQGRTRGGDHTHFHTVNVAQPVRFSSKLQTCPKAMPTKVFVSLP